MAESIDATAENEISKAIEQSTQYSIPLCLKKDEQGGVTPVYPLEEIKKNISFAIKSYAVLAFLGEKKRPYDIGTVLVEDGEPLFIGRVENDELKSFCDADLIGLPTKFWKDPISVDKSAGSLKVIDEGNQYNNWYRSTLIQSACKKLLPNMGVESAKDFNTGISLLNLEQRVN